MALGIFKWLWGKNKDEAGKVSVREFTDEVETLETAMSFYIQRMAFWSIVRKIGSALAAIEWETYRRGKKVKAKGVTVVPVTLHVGLGTFRPVTVEDVDTHVMHSEYYQVTQEAADTLNSIRQKGGRIICVGTTSVRTLETVATEDGIVHPGAGDTAIFIYPGKTIKAVDALITNFHLPQSTLLMLVSAFMGRDTALDVYREAVEEKYRFFSFGDAMFIE